MQKFQKHVQQGLLSFNLNLLWIISKIEILGIPNTRKYFLLFSYINILLLLRYLGLGTRLGKDKGKLGKRTISEAYCAAKQACSAQFVKGATLGVRAKDRGGIRGKG